MEVKVDPEKVLEEYYSIDAQIKELEKRKKELRVSLVDNKEGSYDVGQYTLSVTTRSTSRFDSTSAKEFIQEKGGDLTEFMTESTSTLIKVKKNI